MKRYNYFYDGVAIQKSNFIKNVPQDWEAEVIDGFYSCGYYSAYERD